MTSTDNSGDTGAAPAAQASTAGDDAPADATGHPGFDLAWRRLVDTVDRANHDLRAAATAVLDEVAHLGPGTPPLPDDGTSGQPDLVCWSGEGWRVELHPEGRIVATVPPDGFPAGDTAGERLRDFALALLAAERRRRRRGQDADSGEGRSA
ncbi:hypothetical protein [Saccharothrix sp. HUAS TT1]|uniref:hypothetical protein n=1 Tax=unclassified Saccharothrix TaxID=2593673 RepID=UPI00345BEE3E